jgi:hypothetical protein
MTERPADGVAASPSDGDSEGVAAGFDTGSDASDCLWLVLPDNPYMRAAKQITPSAKRARIFRVLRSAFVSSGKWGRGFDASFRHLAFLA